MFNTVPPQSASRASFQSDAASFAAMQTVTAPHSIEKLAKKPSSSDEFLSALAAELKFPTLRPVLWELAYFSGAFIAGLGLGLFFFGLVLMVLLILGLIFSQFDKNGNAPRR